MEIIYRVAQKYIRKFPFLRDEILSAASWGYVNSYKRCPHDAAEGYITLSIRREIVHAINNYLRQNNLIVETYQSTPEPDIEYLPYQEIIKLRLEGYKYREIAKKLGVTEQHIWYIMRKIRNAYREINDNAEKAS